MNANLKFEGNCRSKKAKIDNDVIEEKEPMILAKYTAKVWELVDGWKTIGGGAITIAGVLCMKVPILNFASSSLIDIGITTFFVGIGHKGYKNKDKVKETIVKVAKKVIK